MFRRPAKKLGCAGVRDYLIDALALHDHMHLLHEVLADPGVLKVRISLLCLLRFCVHSSVQGEQHVSLLAAVFRPMHQSTC